MTTNRTQVPKRPDVPATDLLTITRPRLGVTTGRDPTDHPAPVRRGAARRGAGDLVVLREVETTKIEVTRGTHQISCLTSMAKRFALEL